MLGKKDKAAIAGIVTTSVITNLVWIAVFMQHHNEWKRYCDTILTFTNEMNDMWYIMNRNWKKAYSKMNEEWCTYCNKINEKWAFYYKKEEGETNDSNRRETDDQGYSQDSDSSAADREVDGEERAD